MNINQAAFLTIVPLLFISHAHSAEIVRCVDADENVKYSYKQCASNEDRPIIVVTPPPANEHTAPNVSRRNEYLETLEHDREKRRTEYAAKKKAAREKSWRIIQRYEAAQRRSIDFYIPAIGSETYAEGGKRTNKMHSKREEAAQIARSLEASAKKCRRQ